MREVGLPAVEGGAEPGGSAGCPQRRVSARVVHRFQFWAPPAGPFCCASSSATDERRAPWAKWGMSWVSRPVGVAARRGRPVVPRGVGVGAAPGGDVPPAVCGRPVQVVSLLDEPDGGRCPACEAATAPRSGSVGPSARSYQATHLGRSGRPAGPHIAEKPPPRSTTTTGTEEKSEPRRTVIMVALTQRKPTPISGSRSPAAARGPPLQLGHSGRRLGRDPGPLAIVDLGPVTQPRSLSGSCRLLTHRRRACLGLMSGSASASRTSRTARCRRLLGVLPSCCHRSLAPGGLIASINPDQAVPPPPGNQEVVNQTVAVAHPSTTGSPC